MTVFVTGGTGFLGRRLVVELLRHGHHVRSLVRDQKRRDDLLESVPAEMRGRLEFVTGDLRESASGVAWLRGCDAVIHAAAALSGSPSTIFLDTVVYTRGLVSLAARAGISRFVLVSSLGVYGTDHLKPGSVVDEDCPIEPRPSDRDPYTYAKIAQEEVCWEAHRAGLPLVVVRPGPLYGPGRSFLTTRLGLQVGNVFLRMGGRQIVPSCYVDNCAAALVLALSAPDVTGQAFNLLDDDVPSAKRLLDAYKRRVGGVRVIRIPEWFVRPLSKWYEAYSRRSEGLFPPVITRYKADAMWKPLRYTNARARQVLGWRPDVAFETGLERTIASLLAPIADPR